jgi:hypothetical protein
MRGFYELNLTNGKVIPLRFCTWSLKRFCKLQGIGPSEIGDALGGNEALDAIVNLLKSAAEYEYVSKGTTSTITDIEVCDWIDELGGIGGSKFADVMSALSESMNSGLENSVTSKNEDSEVKKN